MLPVDSVHVSAGQQIMMSHVYPPQQTCTSTPTQLTQLLPFSSYGQTLTYIAKLSEPASTSDSIELQYAQHVIDGIDAIFVNV